MYICINKYESCTHPKMIKLTLFFRTSYSLEAPKKAHTKEKKITPFIIQFTCVPPQYK